MEIYIPEQVNALAQMAGGMDLVAKQQAMQQQSVDRTAMNNLRENFGLDAFAIFNSP